MQSTSTPQAADQSKQKIDYIPFHAKSIEASIELLDSRMTGLNDHEVEKRQKQYGRNLVTGKRSDIARQLFLHQFKNLVVILLFVAALFSFLMHESVNGIAILVAMMINATLSFMTKWKAQKAILALEAFSNPLCTVMRDGIPMRISASDLVPGDVLVFAGGQTVPADARLISSEDVQVDESPLTGESVLISKDAFALHIPDEEITEQKNMIFAGSTIKTGKGQALVTAVGRNSHMGKIAALANSAQRRESHLTNGLNKLGLVIFLMVTILAAVVVFLGYQQDGTHLMSMIQLGIVLVVAAVPEILPAVATFILTLGIERMSKENAIVRNLHAIEAIGSATVICTDKTGTLTENALSVHRIFIPEMGVLDYNPLWSQARSIPCRSVEELLRIGRLNNTTILDGVRSFMMGDPIDVALYRATPAEFETGYHRVREYPFDSTLMLMSAVLKTGDDRFASMIKGAPESVMRVCNYYLTPDGKVVPLDQDKRNELLLGQQDLAMDGILRVIGFAEKPLKTADEEPYQNSVFVGWVCLIDPPKVGVKEAIQQCQEAGVRLIMITGDQKATAAIMAKELGILPEGTEVWTRKDLDSGVEKIPHGVRVFARTQPEEKLAIVQSLQASGDIVAMVGDGVNDAPALRKSDIAIAMGIKGAEAAKESADIILLNDRFETIALAVREGRILTNNVKLSIKYLLSCNMSLVLLMVITAIVGLGLPLNALQILWLNIITVTIPALSLAFEPGTRALLKQPSQSYNQGVLPREHIMLVGFWSLLMTAAGLATFLLSLVTFKQSMETVSTLTFCTIAFAQTLHLLNIQAIHSGMRIKDFLAEISAVPLTWIVMASAAILQIAAVYLPFLQPVLGTVALDIVSWWMPLVFPVLMMLVALFMTRTDPGE
jgi:P-type Ca2+ transporter type 2C